MLLNVRNKFLFIHIAKTGGTSIRTALSPIKWQDPYRIPMFVCSRISSLCGHRIGAKLPRHARTITAQEMLPRELFDNLFKFVFVRNPWDLQVSSFHHLKREVPQLFRNIPDFDGYIKWLLDPKRPYLYHVDTLIKFQHEYIVDINGNEIVDYIGRYENLASDFRTVCKRIGLTSIPALPHKRKAKERKPYQTYYTQETKNIVGDYFEKDIKRFGYSYE